MILQEAKLKIRSVDFRGSKLKTNVEFTHVGINVNDFTLIKAKRVKSFIVILI